MPTSCGRSATDAFNRLRAAELRRRHRPPVCRPPFRRRQSWRGPERALSRNGQRIDITFDPVAVAPSARACRFLYGAIGRLFRLTRDAPLGDAGKTAAGASFDASNAWTMFWFQHRLEPGEPPAAIRVTPSTGQWMWKRIWKRRGPMWPDRRRPHRQHLQLRYPGAGCVARGAADRRQRKYAEAVG